MKRSSPLLIAVLCCAATYLCAVPAVAQNSATVRCPVSVEIPQVVMLTGQDLVTTTQNLSLDASNISFDANLTARGKTSVVWRGNTNSNNGFVVTVQRSAITGTASESLQRDLIISGQPAAGGDVDVEIIGAYNGGVPLPMIADGKAEPFCRTSKPGSANFQVDLQLNAASQHGRGTVNTVLTFVGASI